MELTGKWEMFCKLILSVSVLLLTARYRTGATHVVNFNLQHQQLESNVHLLQDDVKLSRSKRSLETSTERKDPKCESQKEKFSRAVEGGKRLEDTHTFSAETKFSLALAWTGRNDDGSLVVLTTSSNHMVAESTLWRSTNHGRTWADISKAVNNNTFRKDDGLQRNPHEPKWVYLISYENFLYKSENGGETWKKVVFQEGTFIAEELIFHSDGNYKDHIMVITRGGELLRTTDNFDSYKSVRDEHIHSAHWGTLKPGMMYVLYDNNPQSSIFNIILGDERPTYELHRSSGDGDWKVILNNLEGFGIQGDFLYAFVFKDSKPNSNTERLLKVSSDGGDTWNEAQLPTITRDRFYSVLDMSEHLIFLHVDNPGDTGHGTLYTSSSKGMLFSESLQRHLYPNFNSITDFYRVQSMRGTFLASQLSEDNSIHSLISHNLGATWEPLTKPEGVTCKDNTETCSLQVHNLYSIHRQVPAYPPKAVEDAVGMLLVNGHAAKNLQTTNPDVFITTDGGYSWRKVLDGPHAYVIADSGGLIVAISLSTPTPDVVKFSTDEGRCWHEYRFTNESIHHTGLLTEPGGKSMTVAIWGYTVSDKKWTVNVIDFAQVIPDHCTAKDYEDWTAHTLLRKEEQKGVDGCLLGKRVTFKRLKSDSWCHNGYAYQVESSEVNCRCTFEDFECDYGYFRKVDEEKCIEQVEFQGKAIPICSRGHEQKLISEGYRKLPQDSCDEQNGFRPASKLVNLTEKCSGRVEPPKPLPPGLLEENVNKEEHSSNTLVVTVVAIALILLAVAVSYFGYKMVLLRRHKVVYRYSMLSQGEDKDFDDEIERTLTDRPSVFGDISDEEELPADPKTNGHVQRGGRQVKGYHDDSDDDMLQ